MTVCAVAPNVGDAARRPVAVVLAAVLPVARAARPAMVSSTAIEPARRRQRDRNQHASEGVCGGSKQISHESPLVWNAESAMAHLADQWAARPIVIITEA